MKYENIKIGDIVYIQDQVRFGYGSHESFYIPKIVDKITPKRFNVDGQVFRKEDGGEIGDSYSRCYNLGDSTYWGSGVVTDQTNDRRIFMNRVRLFINIKNFPEYIKIDIGHKNLGAIAGKLNEVLGLLKE